MNWRGPASRTAIGVDLGARVVKAIQLAPNGKGWRTIAAAQFALPTGGASLDVAQVRLLSDVLDRQGFRGSELVVAAPASQLITSVLELPARSSGAPLDKIAHAELARMAKLESTGFESSYWELPAPARPTAGTDALAVAMAHTHADALIDLFEAEGLTVCRIDTQAWALTRACGPELAAAPALTGVLDIGWEAARLILVHDGVVVFQRSLGEMGLCALHKKAAGEWKLEADVVEHVLASACRKGLPGSDAATAADAEVRTLVDQYSDSLGAELEASFAYASHRFSDRPVAKLLLVGGGAGLPGMDARLARRHGVETKTISPASVTQVPEALRERAGSAGLMTALGLALPTGDGE
ncbi:MAG: pilus assembly protein PilM [Planctomycetes bacterium]|nr:pilus assembly protein PilM [Planctomycetota bacterium]